MKYGNLTLGQIEAGINKIGGEEAFMRLLRDELVVSEVIVKNFITDTFRLTVDYGQSLEQMINAGHYDWKNNDITAKRFPIEGKGIVEFEARYFHFNRNISSEDALKEIESADTKNPWMPAKIEHVFSHGATFPKEQRKYPIVGLGSVAEVCGSRGVPCLVEGDAGRGLGLRWWLDDWRSGFRFLAVRKVSVS